MKKGKKLYEQLLETVTLRKQTAVMEQKQTDKSLINSEMRYRRLFETAKDGILILDPKTAKIVDANPFIVKALECQLENIIGKQLWEIGLFQNKEDSKRAFDELKMNRYIRFDNMPLQGNKGKKIEVEFVSNVYKVNNTDVIQCNIRDITERNHTNEILKDSEQLLSKTQHIAHIGSFYYALDNNELKWSDELYNILGLQKDLFKVTIESFINRILPEYRSKMLNWIELTAKGIDQGVLEFRIVKTDGTIRDIYGTGILQNDRYGKPHHLIGSAQDITDFKNTERALKESEQHLKAQNLGFVALSNEYLSLNEELIESLSHIQIINKDLVFAKNKAEESDKLKTAFLTNISHEIRTPMNSIMGFSDLLMEHNISKDKAGKFIQIINAGCKQLLVIISDIIDISKIESDQLIIETEIVNIDHLLKDVYDIYKDQFDTKKIGLIYDAKSEYSNLKTETDLNRVKQVLCNLLTNALKFTHIGEVKFGFDLNENFISFYVKDSGIGIEMENQALIFERFRQVDNTKTRLYGGNGLGLSISKALIEKLGGSLTLNSELGTGSTFIFTIPYIYNKDITLNDKKSIVESSFIQLE